MPTVDVVPATGHVPPDGNAGNGVTVPSGATCTTSFASASETSALPLGSIATASAVWPKEKSNAARICGLLTGAVAAPADAPVISVRVAAAAVTREILIGRCLIRALPLIPGNRGSGYQLNERYASHSVSTPGQSRLDMDQGRVENRQRAVRRVQEHAGLGTAEDHRFRAAFAEILHEPHVGVAAASRRNGGRIRSTLRASPAATRVAVQFDGVSAINAATPGGPPKARARRRRRA